MTGSQNTEQTQRSDQPVPEPTEKAVLAAVGSQPTVQAVAERHQPEPRVGRCGGGRFHRHLPPPSWRREQELQSLLTPVLASQQGEVSQLSSVWYV